MATVIDSLMIELGLDTSKFDANQRKSVEQLRKLDDQAQKTAKDIAKGAKDMGEGFTFVKDSLIGLGTVLIGMKMFKDLIGNTTKQNVELGRSAGLLSMTASELKTWGQMAELTGGSVESMTGVIKGLQQSLVDLKYGTASDALIKSASFLKAWGAFDLNTMQVDLYKLSDAIVAFRKSHTEAETLNFAQSLGLDQSSLLLLEKGSDYLRKNHDEFLKLNEAIDKNAATSDKLNQQWVKLKVTGESLGQSLYKSIAEPLSWILDKAFSFGDVLDKLNGKLNNQENKVSGNLPRNLRNNNPGNLKFANQPGAIGADSGGFAIFSSMEAGKAAQEALLKSKYSRGLDTLHKLYYGAGGVKGWLGSGADLKDAPSAISNVMRMTGLGENQRITPDQLAMVRQAMQNNEGMIGAKTNAPAGSGGKTVNSAVSIQNLSVNTQATDANGVAKGINDALQQNILINAGIYGAD